jgi:hypothetical protein
MNLTTMIRWATAGAAGGLIATQARAEVAPPEREARDGRAELDRTGEAPGWASPVILAPRVEPRTATAMLVSGYDSSRGEPTLRVTTDVTVVGPVAIRLGGESTGGELTPSIGVRVQLLERGRHGVDAGAGLVYEATGYEGEPELKAVVSGARELGRVSLAGNAVYGQELDEPQRHGELRLSAMSRLRPGLHAGLDGRVRLDLDHGRTTEGVRDVDFDFLAAPTAVITLGRFALLGQAGATGLRYKGDEVQLGAIALGGVGARF